MNPLAITLVLLAVFANVAKDVLTKKAVDKQVFQWWFTMLSIVVTLPFAAVYVMREGVSAFALGVTALIAFVHVCYWLSLTEAYVRGDLSHVYPLARSSPAFVFLVSILFFGERLALTGSIGMLLVILGGYMIFLPNFRSFFTPIAALRTEPSTRLALLALVLSGTSSLLDKQAVSLMHPFLYAFFATLFAWIWFSFYVFVAKDRANMLREWNMSRRNIFLNAVFGAVSYMFLLYALSLERVTYVIGLKQLGVVLAVIAGGTLLQEKAIAIRLPASLLIFLGAFLITLG